MYTKYIENIESETRDIESLIENATSLFKDGKTEESIAASLINISILMKMKFVDDLRWVKMLEDAGGIKKELGRW